MTQAELYCRAVKRLTERHPTAREVVVGLLWGGLEGVKVKPAYTFRSASEVTT